MTMRDGSPEGHASAGKPRAVIEAEGLGWTPEGNRTQVGLTFQTLQEAEGAEEVP